MLASLAPVTWAWQCRCCVPPFACFSYYGRGAARFVPVIWVCWPSVTSNPDDVGHAGSWLVTVVSGLVTVSRNVFELLSPCRHFALYFQSLAERQRCIRSAFEIVFASQCCPSQHTLVAASHRLCCKTLIAVNLSRFSAATTSRLLRPFSFKETIRCLAYLERRTAMAVYLYVRM